ncbi:MAG TPA: hypothetical protein VLN56_06310 [Gammaproteobacteria bacterium]|nr:hypothetical protein [Gammaproteobacteria bacterium]
MAYRVLKMNYCKMTVPSRAGQGEKILKAIRDAGISLQAFTGFPSGGGKAQVDLIADKLGKIRTVAKKEGWRLSKTKKMFLVQGNDELGAVHKVIKRLGDAKINLTAVDAVTAGKGRYGMLMWVKQKDYRKAARALNAK